MHCWLGLRARKPVHRSIRKNKVLHVEEIRALVARMNRRVLAIYHHLWTDNLNHHHALDLFDDVSRFAYNFGNAAILLLQGPDGFECLWANRRIASAVASHSRRMCGPTGRDGWDDSVNRGVPRGFLVSAALDARCQTRKLIGFHMFVECLPRKVVACPQLISSFGKTATPSVGSASRRCCNNARRNAASACKCAR